MKFYTREIYYLIIGCFTFVFSLMLAAKIISIDTDLAKTRQLQIYSFMKNRLIYFFMAVYFCIFSISSIVKYNAYNLAMVDLGRMDQVIWNILQGRFFFGTVESGNMCRLSMHCEFIYLLIAPLYLLYSSPKTILVLQSLIVSLGALPIFWLTREKIGSYFLALCFSTVYLMNPSLQYGNLRDFHPDMLATTFLLFSFYFLDKNEFFKYFVFLLLSLMCKEYISLIAVTMGIYILFAYKNAKIAWITISLGSLWFLITYKFIPYCLQVKDNTIIHDFAILGESLEGVFRNIIFHPIAVFYKFLTMENIANSLLLLLPLGFLPLLKIRILALGLPIFVGAVLCSFFSYANHHNGTIIPFLFISSIFGAKSLIDKFKPRYKNITYALGVFIFSCGLFSNIFYGPSLLSWRFWDKSSYGYWNSIHNLKVTEHDKIADKCVKMVPNDVSVSASNHLASHISQRETIYHFPYPFDFSRIDYVLVDLLEYFTPGPVLGWPSRQKEIDSLRDALLNYNFFLRHYEDGIILLQKGVKEESDYFFNAEIIKEASPKHIVGLSFGRRIRLVGYDLNNKYLESGTKQRISYYWQVLEDFNRGFLYKYYYSTENLNTDYIIIDTFTNQKDEFRIVHLPIYVLLQPKDWRVGDIIKEDFDFYIPDNISSGDYNWKIGLYVVPKNYFIETANRNLVPGTVQIDLGSLRKN